MATLFNTKIKDTYQSLLKLEDNTILTTTVKNVTDGLGNASPLYMSTTQIGIGTSSPTGTLQIKGSGSTASTSSLIIQNSLSNLALRIFDNNTIDISTNSLGNQSWSQNISFLGSPGEIKIANNGGGGFFTSFTFGANELMRLNSALQVGIGTTTPNARLGVRGSGSTSATTSLLVQNSAGTPALTVRDDLYVFGGSRVYSTGNMYMDGNTGTLFSAWGQLQLQGASYVQIMNDTLRAGSQNFTFQNTSFSPNAATNSNLRLVGNSAGFTNAGAGGTSIGNALEIPIGIATSIGNVTLNHIHINGVVNTTAGTTLQRGFYYNPTLTGTVGFTHNAIETVTGNVLLGTTSGFVGIGTSSPTEKLDVVGNIKSLGTLNISIPSINTLANGSIIAAPSGHGRPYAVDFTIGAYTLGTNDNQLHFGTRNSGVFFTGSQMYTYGIPTQIWGTSTGPNNCSSLHIGVNSTSEYQTGTAYPSTADNYFYLSTVIVAPNGSIYSPTRPTPTRRKFIFSASELIFHTGDAGVEVGRIFSNGNWAINTTTDAGYKLDINGSTRVKANSLTISASGLSSPPANYVALNFDDAPNHHEKWFAINSKKDLYGAIGTGYDRIIFPTMGNDDSTWEFNALGSYSRILISARNSTTGNYLSLTNSSINFTGPWTVVSIDRTNRKLVFGNMSTDVHHIEVYDLVIKGAQPFESNAGGSVANGGNVYVVGGTPSTSPAGNYGNVILAHDGTSARGSAVVGGTTPAASAIVDVQSTTKGVLFPRMTNAQRGLIASPAIGLLVYCTDATEGLYIYKSTGWTFIA